MAMIFCTIVVVSAMVCWIVYEVVNAKPDPNDEMYNQ